MVQDTSDFKGQPFLLTKIIKKMEIMRFIMSPLLGHVTAVQVYEQ